jgi:2-C-methyl-D-erythritol 2,4-cyclodiphosphate synthase
MKYKTGHGYDVHRLSSGIAGDENRKLILGGVEIPNGNNGLIGHSDADVLIHAVIDSLLGAAGLGDIGEHFPDSEEKYKNISSVILLEKIADLIKKDYIISNIDCTVILEKPKLSNYKDAIREKLSGVLGIDKSDINIKATTEEGLGFTGKEEGIAVHAVCLLQQKQKQKPKQNENKIENESETARKLAVFENMCGEFRKDMDNLPERLEKLRSNGKEKTVAYKELVAQKLINTNILMFFKKHGINIDD